VAPARVRVCPSEQVGPWPNPLEVTGSTSPLPAMGGLQCGCPQADKDGSSPRQETTFCSFGGAATVSGEIRTDVLKAEDDQVYADSFGKMTHTASVKFKSGNGIVQKKFSSRPVGLRLGMEYYNLPVVVMAVNPDGAAQAQGIQSGWEVMEVNGQSIATMAPLELEQFVCGPLDAHYLRLQSLLDVFDDFRTQIPLLQVFFEEHADLEAKASALANKAASIANPQSKSPDLAAELLPNVVANLKAVTQKGPVSQNIADVCKLLFKYIDGWKFDTTGKCDTPPALSDATEAGVELSQAELNIVHTLSYVHFPPKFHNYATFIGLTGELSRDMPHAPKPHAIITVGPPGSGKSYMISSEFGCVNYLQTSMKGPPAQSYVEIDPDFWITNLCGNDNAYRPLCNMVNLENFFFSVNQKYNIIFGGTGKDIKNTCGRVTARLKQANYTIYYAIVLSSYENCMLRIKDRFEKTGRNVPDFVVKALFKGLQESVPLFLKNQAALCDAILVYENNVMGVKPTPVILSGGQDPTAAIALVNKILELPQDQPKP